LAESYENQNFGNRRREEKEPVLGAEPLMRIEVDIAHAGRSGYEKALAGNADLEYSRSMGCRKWTVSKCAEDRRESDDPNIMLTATDDCF
jgi:hypothetical protein